MANVASLRRNLLKRIDAAVSATRASMNLPDTHDNMVGPGGYPAFVREEAEMLAALSSARRAAEAITARLARQSEASPDPAVTAAMRLYPPPPGSDGLAHGERVIAIHELLAGLTMNDAELPPAERRARGRPAVRDPLVRVAVRGTMHFLHDQGRPMSGGSRYPGSTNRARERRGKQLLDEEQSLDGAARFVVTAVRRAGLVAAKAEILGHMRDYAIELRKKKRGPMEEDYIIPDPIIEEGSILAGESNSPI
jgi:hypothetical protein